MLLRHGANILARDCNGRTVLEAAEANNAPEETLKEIHSVKMDQERERYAANMALDQKGGTHLMLIWRRARNERQEPRGRLRSKHKETIT